MARLKTTEEYKIELFNATNGEFEIIGDYKGALKNITYLHKSYNHTFSIRYGHFSETGFICPVCKKEKYRVEQEKIFLSKVKKLTCDEYTVLNKYISSHIDINIKHNICGTEYLVEPANFLSGKRCRKCYFESRKGENNNRWKGGITSLTQFLRDNIKEWKKLSMKKDNYKCIFTNERFHNVHHLYSFNKIIQETLECLKIDIRDNISKYTEEELDTIKLKFLDIHNKYGLGVCLCKRIHDLYHNLYEDDNTPEQFQEFTERYNSGEFNNIIQ